MIYKIVGKISFKDFIKGKIWVFLLILLYIDILVIIGGLYILVEIGGFIND